jgi:hypothetical protein
MKRSPMPPRATTIKPSAKRMSTKQLSRYMEDVQAHYAGRVDLQFPVEQRVAA